MMNASEIIAALVRRFAPGPRPQAELSEPYRAVWQPEVLGSMTYYYTLGPEGQPKLAGTRQQIAQVAVVGVEVYTLRAIGPDGLLVSAMLGGTLEEALEEAEATLRSLGWERNTESAP